MPLRSHTMLPGVLLLCLSTPSSGGQDPPVRIVNIVAERFAFTPSRISVREGTVLELRITSDDTSHGFRLRGPTEVDVEIPKRNRGDVRVRVEAREPGTYVFECSRVCGAGHGFMRGTLRVTR